MPIGVICNVLAVAIGGLIGAKGGSKMSAELKEKLNLVFGVCSMGIGISSIILMQNMPAVVLSLIVGTIIGIVTHLGKRIENGGKKLARLVPGQADADNALLVTAIVLFCASGTGIYGSIVSGMSGNHSILLAKSILDIFTAMIFACSLGLVTSLVAVPQFIIFMLLFLCARLIFPLTTPAMINDFKACGGLIMLATGFRIAKIHDFPIADMIPAMILVWPVSYAWAAWIVPMM
ncbi:MAG: DUF554 domain-containing protein [Lachnospiraceae bacterium]|nr:DUF554 domain-containing protein [Lachnospiraceae bacterium]